MYSSKRVGARIAPWGVQALAAYILLKTSHP